MYSIGQVVVNPSPTAATSDADSGLTLRQPVPNKTNTRNSSSGPRSIDKGTYLCAASSNCAIGSKICTSPGLTRTTAPAGTPAPSALAVKIPWETFLISVNPTLIRLSLSSSNLNSAGPSANPSGTRKLICSGEAKKNLAAFSTPAESLTMIFLPASVVGNIPWATSVLVVRSEPNPAMIISLVIP